MKIYLVVEEYKGEKRVLHVYSDYGQIDYSQESAIELRDEWDKQHGYLGAKYYIKEVEL